MKKAPYIFLLCSFSLWISACKHKTTINPASNANAESNYPEAIERILVDKCATAGCHNETSYTGAGSLRLDTWNSLFDGSSNGAVVIPYAPENSSLLYFVNNNPDLGTTAEPLMPYNQPPLSEEEYLSLKSWIASGAPAKNGNIPFAANTGSKQKIYMVQYGCDLVGVIDADRNVVMRYIRVGNTYDTENPNNIVMSPNGNYAYVSFWNTDLIQKIDTRTDSVIAELTVPRAFQKAIQINNNGNALIACNWYTHELLMVNTETMTISQNLGSSIRFIAGFVADNEGGFIASSQFGNAIYHIKEDGSYTTHSLDGKPITNETSAITPDPYRLIMSNDGSKYFVSCTNTNEVVVMSSNNDERIASVKVGENPQELAISTTQPYLFVTCMNDTVSKLEVGSVYVINYNTYEVVKVIRGKFFQPHGIAVDDTKGLMYIFSRNEDKNGPPPHHSSPCNGRNGFYQVYDINALEPATSKRFEVTVDPYTAASRY